MSRGKCQEDYIQPNTTLKVLFTFSYFIGFSSSEVFAATNTVTMKPSGTFGMSNKSDKSLPSPRSRIPRRSSLSKSDISSGSQSNNKTGGITPTTTNTTYVLDSAAGENSRSVSSSAGRTYTADSHRLTSAVGSETAEQGGQTADQQGEVTLADYLCPVEMSAITDLTNQTLMDADSTLHSDKHHDSDTTPNVTPGAAAQCDNLVSIDGTTTATVHINDEVKTNSPENSKLSPSVNLMNFSSANNTIAKSHASGSEITPKVITPRASGSEITPNVKTSLLSSTTAQSNTGSGTATPLLVSLSGDRSISATPKSVSRIPIPASQLMAERSHDILTPAASVKSSNPAAGSSDTTDWQALHLSLRTNMSVSGTDSHGQQEQTKPALPSSMLSNISVGNGDAITPALIKESANTSVPSQAVQNGNNIPASNLSSRNLCGHNTSALTPNISVGESGRPITPLTDPADHDPLRTSSRISDVVNPTPPVTPNVTPSMPHKTTPVIREPVNKHANSPAQTIQVQITQPSPHTTGKTGACGTVPCDNAPVNDLVLPCDRAPVNAVNDPPLPVRDLERSMEKSIQQLKHLAESYDTSSGSESLPMDAPYSRGDDVSTPPCDDVSMHENTRPISPIGLISDLTITGQDREGKSNASGPMCLSYVSI